MGIVCLLSACAAGRGASSAHFAPSPAGPETWLGQTLQFKSPLARALPGPGGLVVVSDDRGVLLHDLGTGRDLESFPVPGAQATAISADGSLIAAASDRRVEIFRRGSPRPVATARLEEPPWQVAFDRGGTRLLALVTGPPSALVALDARSAAVLNSFRFAPDELPLRLYPDFVVVEHRKPAGESSSGERALVLHDLTGKPLRTWSLAGIAFVAFDSDGRRAAVLGTDGSLRVVEQGTTGTVTTLWSRTGFEPGHAGGRPVQFSPEDGRLAIVTRSGEITVFEAASGKLERTVRCDSLGGAILSPDLRVALNPTGFDACELQSGEPSRTFRSVWRLREEAGRVVALMDGGGLGEVTVAFDPRSGTAGAPTPWKEELPAKQLLHDQPWLAHLVVSANGRRAIAAWGDCLMVHQRSNPGATWGGGHCLRSPGELTEKALISGDGRRALAASRNHVLMLWDLERSKIDGTFEIPASITGIDHVDLAALSADGRWALASVRDNTQAVTLVGWRDDSSLARWTLLASETPFHEDLAVDVTSGGDQAAVGLPNGEVLLIDGGGRTERLMDLGPSLDYARAPLFLDDGSTLVVGTARGGVFAFRSARR